MLWCGNIHCFAFVYTTTSIYIWQYLHVNLGKMTIIHRVIGIPSSTPDWLCSGKKTLQTVLRSPSVQPGCIYLGRPMHVGFCPLCSLGSWLQHCLWWVEDWSHWYVHVALYHLSGVFCLFLSQKNHEIWWNIWDWAVVCQKDAGCIRDSFFALDLESNTAISCNFQSAMLACLVAKCLGHKILVQRCCHLFLLGCQICLVQIARIIGWCISSPWSTTMATWSLERTVTWTSCDYGLYPVFS